MLPLERMPLSAKTGDLFVIEFEVPLLERAERYADKLVAVLYRQNPSDVQAKGLLGPENTFDHFLLGRRRAQAVEEVAGSRSCAPPAER